jgi:outer membrane autotransporter protein
VLRALDLLSGEAYATAVGLAAGDTETIHRTLLTRLRTTGPAGIAAAPGAQPLAYAPAPAVTKAPFPPAPRTPAMLVDLWGQGFGTWGSREGRDGLGVASADRTTGGFILGAETSFDTTWRIGMAGAYTQTSFDIVDRLSSGSIDSYHAALYGSGTWGGFALRGGATYTHHDLDVNRNAVMRGFSDEADGSLSLDSAGLFAEIGYPVRFGRLTAEPVASLSYVHTGRGSFTEDGGDMALRGRTNAFDTAWTTLGVRLSGDLTEDGRLKGYSLLGWRHAFGDVMPTTVNQFITGSDPFLIIGNPIDRDSLVVETGLDWFVTPAVALGVRYDGQYGSRDHSQSVRGQLTAQF